MKTKRNYYPIAAATSLVFGILIPMSLADEKKPTKIAEIIQASADDRLVNALTERIITPLTEQEKRSSGFSRMRPAFKTSYHLVENTVEPSAGNRNFNVIAKRTSLFKGAEETSHTYLKLRYLEKQDQVLVKVKDSWVELDDHPLLGKFSKAKPAEKVES